MADQDFPTDELTDELEDDGIVWLEDAEGEVIGFGVLGVIDHEGQDYILLSPVAQLEDGPESDEPLDVMIMQYDVDEVDGAESFTPVDDDDLFAARSQKAEQAPEEAEPADDAAEA